MRARNLSCYTHALPLGAVRPAELAADATELTLLRGREDPHGFDDALHVHRQYSPDELPTPVSELDHVCATVIGIARSSYETGTLEVRKHRCEVAAALEQLGGELAWRQRPEVQERVEHAKLAFGETLSAVQPILQAASH